MKNFVFKVYIRSGNGPKGPLTAREIKERVTVEYEQVSTQHHMADDRTTTVYCYESKFL